MNWTPSPTVALALATGLAMPLLVLALGHGPWRIASEARRFVVALGMAAVAWGLGVAVLFERGEVHSLYDVIAGALLILTSGVGYWTLWSILCWGFTTSLLVAIAESEVDLAAEEWFRAYGGGSSLEGFTRDRLSILLATGLAASDADRVKLDRRRAALVARVARVLRRAHGVRND
jgi:hypothetical protein